MVVSWVDMAALLIVGLYVWQGMDRSIFIILADMISWVVGFYTLWHGHEWLGSFFMKHLSLERSLAMYVAYIFIFLVAQQITYRLLTQVVTMIDRQYLERHWQGFVGILPGIISGIGLVSLLMVAFTGFPGSYPLKDELIHSQAGQLVSPFLR